MGLVDIATDLAQKGIKKLKSDMKTYNQLVRTMSRHDNKRLIAIYKTHDGLEKRAAFRLLVLRGVVVKK